MAGMELFLLCGVLGSVSGQFFHETSGVTLKPSGSLKTSAFGFSIAYQKHKLLPARLVVGAPREDYVGKVYSCPLSDLSTINCSVIDMTSLQIEKKTAAARRLKNPDSNYFLGSSIAATPEYFFTCAPMLIKTILLYIKRQGYLKFSETFGGCYVSNYNNATEWIDSAARFEDNNNGKKKRKYPFPISITSVVPIMGGGLGWSTLVDDSFLIAAKSGFKTDVMYTNVENPRSTSKSLLEDEMDEHPDDFKKFYNLGYGLAAGTFFNESEKLYAVSVKKGDTNGTIFFLQKKFDEFRGFYLDMMEDSNFKLITLETQALSSMFGYAMAAADMNSDGLSELMVGAPAQVDEGRREVGALHVYVGGDLLSRNDEKRMRTLLADKVNGRFGSTIATSDIDGDSIPEIFVSAPYEDSGVVYALCGYELKQVFFREDGFQLARLSELKLTQALRGDGGLRLFGFSLQVVKDVDENGCDELAIGAPDSSSVKLVRCLPAVNTSLSLELLGDSIVAVDAKSFTIQVCLNVTILKKCQSVSGYISVESVATGRTKILSPQFTHKITVDSALPHCEKIIVNFTIDAEQTDYTFTTKLSINRDDPNPGAYNSWAVFSAYSEKEKSIQVRRYCTGAHCKPVLSYKTYWSGSDTIDFSKSEVMNETLTFVLNNTNYDAHYVVLELLVRGAVVRSGECAINKNIINVNNDVMAYTCALVTMLKKDESYNLTVPIYLADPTNSPSLDISAKLYDAVFPDEPYQDKPLVVPYKLEASDVTVNGSSNSLNVTDKDLKDGIIFAESSGINQEFIISNNGPVTWYGLLAVLQIENQYIQRVTVVTRSENEKWVLQKDYDTSKIVYHSRMTVMPKTKKIIEVSVRLSKDKLESDVSKGNLRIISELSFVLDPLSETLKAKSSTEIIYNQILSVGNNKWLIILIVVILAVLLLLILMFVLYKNGFFKRAEKKKLNVLRESIRKRSVRLASENSRGARPSVADGNHCDIEVVDDCAFHEVDLAPTSTRSDLSLIETSSKEQPS